MKTHGILLSTLCLIGACSQITDFDRQYVQREGDALSPSKDIGVSDISVVDVYIEQDQSLPANERNCRSSCAEFSRCLVDKRIEMGQSGCAYKVIRDNDYFLDMFNGFCFDLCLAIDQTPSPKCIRSFESEDDPFSAILRGHLCDFSGKAMACDEYCGGPGIGEFLECINPLKSNKSKLNPCHDLCMSKSGHFWQCFGRQAAFSYASSYELGFDNDFCDYIEACLREN